MGWGGVDRRIAAAERGILAATRGLTNHLGAVSACTSPIVRSAVEGASNNDGTMRVSWAIG